MIERYTLPEMGALWSEESKFASWLENVLKLPIVLWDERLTTKQALNILNQQKISGKKKKKLKDQISAAIILSVYLESKRKKSNAHKHH